MAEHATGLDQALSSDASTTTDPDVRMVLRTVYLPPTVDDELRVRAFHSNQTKNELIREAVMRWLSAEGANPSAPAKAKTARRATPRSRTASRKATAKKA